MPLILFALLLAWAVMLLFGGGEFDRGLLILLYTGERAEFVPYARLVTELGGWQVLVPVTAAGALWLLIRRDWRSALLLAVLTLSGRLLVALQKDWTARIRPEEHEHLVAVQSLSFPSGHAANAAMVWLALAFLLTRTYPARALAVWAAAFLTLGSGISRVLLGVHWPSDVIGGWAFGLFWTLLLLRLAGHPLDEGTRDPAWSFLPRRSADLTDKEEEADLPPFNRK